MPPTTPTFLDKLLEAILSADTQIGIIIFLTVGIVSTIWQIAVHPLLLKFSERYRIYSAKAELDHIKPLLSELGILEESKRIRSLKLIKSAQSGRPEEVLKSQLVEIMHIHYTSTSVRLGRQHSQQNSYFIDLRAAAMNINYRELMADIQANSISNEIRRNIGNVEFKEYNHIIGFKEGNPLVTASTAQKLKLPLALFRGLDFPKFHGSDNPLDFFDGSISEGENVILVDDATFRGTTLINATKLLTSMNVHVVGVFLLFEPTIDQARKSFTNLNIPFYSVIKIDEQLEKQLKKHN